MSYTWHWCFIVHIAFIVSFQIQQCDVVTFTPRAKRRKVTASTNILLPQLCIIICKSERKRVSRNGKRVYDPLVLTQIKECGYVVLRWSCPLINTDLSHTHVKEPREGQYLWDWQCTPQFKSSSSVGLCIQQHLIYQNLRCDNNIPQNLLSLLLERFNCAYVSGK